MFTHSCVVFGTRVYAMLQLYSCSFKPQSLQSGNLELYPKRKLARTKGFDLRVESRTPPHLRILQMEGKVYRKPVLRGQSNPLE